MRLELLAYRVGAGALVLESTLPVEQAATEPLARCALVRQPLLRLARPIERHLKLRLVRHELRRRFAQRACVRDELVVEPTRPLQNLVARARIGSLAASASSASPRSP